MNQSPKFGRTEVRFGRCLDLFGAMRMSSDFLLHFPRGIYGLEAVGARRLRETHGEVDRDRLLHHGPAHQGPASPESSSLLRLLQFDL